MIVNQESFGNKKIKGKQEKGDLLWQSQWKTTTPPVGPQSRGVISGQGAADGSEAQTHE